MNKQIIEPIEPFGLSSKDHKKTLFSKIGVVGCGKEGRNIVNLTASAGLDVVFMELSEERIDYVMDRLSHNLDTKIINWGLTQSEKKSIMNRITPTLKYEDFAGCDFVIECSHYSETGKRSVPLRKQIFQKLEEVLSPDAIIASNGPTVIITELSAQLKYKERCVSVYFPVIHPDARILEIVEGTYTSNEVYEKMEYFAKLINYVPQRLRESNGNVSMRLMVTMLNEACQIYMEGLTSLENIENTLTVVYGQRYGVFRMADMIGIEKLVTFMEAMFDEYGDKKYKPNPVLLRLYRSNQIGVRSGKGFYIYDKETPIGINKAIL